MSGEATVWDTLEVCAERGGDISPLVYERFFETCPAADSLMGHSDDHMRGRMLEQTFELLLSDEHLGEGGYLDWELDNHLLAYQVAGSMYEHFLGAIRDVVERFVGTDWTSNDTEAWDEQINKILEKVQQHPACQGENA